MTEAKTLEIYDEAGVQIDITITPVIERMGDISFLTGVYRLHEGPIGYGEIVIDQETNEWEYTGVGELSPALQERIVAYIKEQTQKGK